jgi:PAS domain S-box-containing protein
MFMCQNVDVRLRNLIPEIMHRWDARVRAEIPAAEHQRTSVLHDHLAKMLEVMAKVLADRTDPATAAMDLGYIITHGVERAGISDYTLEQMILECQVLQEVVFILLESERALDVEDRVAIIAYFGGVLRQAAGAFARTQQKERRARDAVYRTMVEDVRDYAIFFVDPEGRVNRWNAGAQRITGFTEEDILDQPASLLFTPEDRAAGVPEKELAQAAATGRAGDDRWQQKKDGSLYWAQGVTTGLRSDDGHLVGFCKVMRDGTRQKQLEEDLRARVEDLNHADRAKNQFLAMLGHELRNPIGVASNALYLLRISAGEMPALQRPLESLERQMGHMSRLVNDLLDVARVTQGKVRIEKNPVRLDQVATAAMQGWREQIEAKGLEIRYGGEPDVVVTGDAFRLEQVMTNLLNNALKYTERGSISVTLRGHGDEAELTVSDTGIGMPAETLAHAFDLFSQGNVSLARSQGGLGVGLTIVQQIVELHGGRVAAHSPGPDQGSAGIITLPRWQGNPAAADAAAAADDASAHPMRVLVVEDNRDAAAALVEILEIWGHTARAVHDGRAALDDAVELRPQVVLLDIGLPGMDGFAVAAWLRERPELAGTRLIGLTGYDQADDQRRIKASGFDEYLLKPVDLKKLKSLLNED